MSLLDKLHDKALEQKGNRKHSLLIASGIIDYAVGTHEEVTAHRTELKNTQDERVGKKDYQLYTSAEMHSLLGEGCLLVYLISQYLQGPYYMVTADILTRCVNILRTKKKSNRNISGLIGTARTLGYKIADKFRRNEIEPEIEEDVQ